MADNLAFPVDTDVQWHGMAERGRLYSRDHVWRFDGGASVAASASPEVVPEPGSNPALIDPEEALVAALSSCHMLFFLSIAAANGFAVTDYHDRARGWLETDASGRAAITRIELSPSARYFDAAPTPEQESEWHDRAHARCFIANSLRAEVKIAPRREQGPEATLIL